MEELNDEKEQPHRLKVNTRMIEHCMRENIASALSTFSYDPEILDFLEHYPSQTEESRDRDRDMARNSNPMAVIYDLMKEDEERFLRRERKEQTKEELEEEEDLPF